VKARVTLTPALLKRLLDGKPLQFKFPITDYHETHAEIEIIIEEDIFAKFDRVFSKVWNKALDKIDKLT
jgi:hypothetical protein